MGDRARLGGPVLVVDDEPEVRDLLVEFLAADGWTTAAVGSGEEALALVETRRPEAVILDVNLAGESGYEVCRRIRRISPVPIIFLTARSDEFDHVLGLELGGDEFLTKPFSGRILLAHLEALTRRAGERPADARAVLAAGPVELEPRARRVRVGGEPLALTKTEFDLLALFVTEPSRAFDRQTLLDQVWGEWFSDDHVLDVTIGRLRRKLETAGAPGMIETLRGVGFRLVSA